MAKHIEKQLLEISQLAWEIMEDGRPRHLAEKIRNKVRETLESEWGIRVKCPFSTVFPNEPECVYLTEGNGLCGIDVCPGNGDAWCHEMIDLGITRSKSEKSETCETCGAKFLGLQSREVFECDYCRYDN
jgi:hypothetical protein